MLFRARRVDACLLSAAAAALAALLMVPTAGAAQYRAPLGMGVPLFETALQEEAGPVSIPVGVEAARAALAQETASGGRIFLGGFIGATLGTIAGGALGVALSSDETSLDDFLDDLLTTVLLASAGSTFGSVMGAERADPGPGQFGSRLLTSTLVGVGTWGVAAATESGGLLLLLPILQPTALALTSGG